MVEFMGKCRNWHQGVTGRLWGFSWLLSVPGQSTHGYLVQFLKRPLGIETRPCERAPVSAPDLWQQLLMYVFGGKFVRPLTMPFLSFSGTQGRQVLEVVGVGGMRVGVFPAILLVLSL